MTPVVSRIGAAAAIAFASMAVAAPAVLTVPSARCRSALDGGDGMSVARLAGDEAKLPKEIPDAFAKLLDPAGVKVVDAAGKPFCELWLRAEIPFAAKPTTENNVKLDRIPYGTFVGALHTCGALHDFRDQELAAGVYGLRFVHQPVNGDHLGTSDSRDFLMVTSFATDQETAAVGKEEALVALSKPVSPTEHPVVLYVAQIPDEEGKSAAPANASEKPRWFKRGEKKEWAVELALRGKASGEKSDATFKVGLVLVGHVAE